MNAPISRQKLETLTRLVAEIRRREDRDRYEDSFRDFFEAAWPHIDVTPYKPGWHLDAVAEHLTAVADGEIRNLIINEPPRHSKTKQCSVAFPAWIWAQTRREGYPLLGPHVSFMCLSYGLDLSLDSATLNRRLINGLWYQALWGDRYQLASDQDAKSKFDNTQGGTRISSSFEGGVLGRGAAIRIIDDPHKVSDVESEVVRKGVLETYENTLRSRVTDPKTSAQILVMQRIHESDLTGYILDNEEDVVHLMLPAEFDPPRKCVTVIGWEDPRKEAGDILWPEQFGARELAPFKKNKYIWSGQYQQIPTPQGGGILRAEWWKVWPPNGEELDRDGKPKRPLEFPPMDYILMTVDTALTTKEENDWSAATVWGVFRDPATGHPAIMLMDAWQDRLEFRPLVDKIMATASGTGTTRPPVDQVLIEAKMNGHSVAQEITRLCRKGQYGIRLDKVEGDKVARAYSVQHFFSSGLVYAPNRQYAEMTISNCAAFPKGQHDDLTDTVTAALRFLRRMNIAQFGDEYQEELAARMGPTRNPEPFYPV